MNIVTRSGFTGSSDDTQAFSLRLHLTCTPNSNPLLPQTPSANWLRSTAVNSLHTTRRNHRAEHQVFNGLGCLGHRLARASNSRTVPILTAMRVRFPEGATVVPLRSPMKTLPRATATAMEHRLCRALSDEFFCQHNHTFMSTYILGTMVDQTTTVATLPSRRLPTRHRLGRSRSMLAPFGEPSV